MSDQEMRVFKIKDGTVIDHILPKMSMKIINVLGIRDYGLVSIGINFYSPKTGKKDIIKYENVYLDKKETDIIALFSPHATINIIKDYKVVEKRKIDMPKEIYSIIRCPNPICVTNHYKDCESRFSVERYDDQSTTVRCFYCEKESIVELEMIK